MVDVLWHLTLVRAERDEDRQVHVVSTDTSAEVSLKSVVTLSADLFGLLDDF